MNLEIVYVAAHSCHSHVCDGDCFLGVVGSSIAFYDRLSFSPLDYDPEVTCPEAVYSPEISTLISVFDLTLSWLCWFAEAGVEMTPRRRQCSFSRFKRTMSVFVFDDSLACLTMVMICD